MKFLRPTLFAGWMVSCLLALHVVAQNPTTPAQPALTPDSAAPAQPAATPAPAEAPKKPQSETFTHSTTEPAPRTEGWVKRHEKLNEQVKQGDYDLLFVGDSITEGWAGNGKAVWDQYYRPRKALNLGFGGDRTQNVLWRLQNGNLEGLHPKLAVLMIGTNNSNNQDNTAEEIADGIKAIVAELRQRLPDTKVLLLAVFPRGEKPSQQREKNAKASELASKDADDKMVFYMDIGPKYLADDATLSRTIMPDLLHLNRKGYEMWAEAIEPKVAELMGEPAPAAAASPETAPASSAQ